MKKKKRKYVKKGSLVKESFNRTKKEIVELLLEKQYHSVEYLVSLSPNSDAVQQELYNTQGIATLLGKVRALEF